MVKKKVSKTSTKTKVKQQKITKDILMGELVNEYPKSMDILMKYGFHCVGCAMSPYEPLESGAVVHGIPLEPLLKELNELAD
ncbi:DUF1858 domain-containing protein [Patescibacteria group bacterium]|nr:DUF1858 domain-containing protein [Patescibacteria group bacterium]